MWQRFASLPIRNAGHDGRQRRQRLADRRLDAGADRARRDGDAAQPRARRDAAAGGFLRRLHEEGDGAGRDPRGDRGAAAQRRRCSFRDLQALEALRLRHLRRLRGFAIELRRRPWSPVPHRLRRHGGDAQARRQRPKPRVVGKPWTEATAAAAHGRRSAPTYAPLSRHAGQRRLSPAGARRICCTASGSRRGRTPLCGRRERQRLRRRSRGPTRDEPASRRFMARSQAAPAAGVGRIRTSRRTCTSPATRPTSTTSRRSPAPCTRRSASRRRRTAACSRSTSPRCAPTPGVVAVLTAADIPGPNDCGPIIHDDPILADGVVQYVGQPMFAVSPTRDASRRAARRGKATVDYRAAAGRADAAAKRKRLQSYVLPPMHLGAATASAAIAAAPHRLAGELYVGGQEQFYLEGQISYAVPQEDDGMLALLLDAASERDAARGRACAGPALATRCTVECRRMGGGFGGKESQSALFACVAAVAARKLRRPVKLRLDRDDDFMVTGKRHCFHYEYEVGYDDDGRDPRRRADDGWRAPASPPTCPARCARARLPLRQHLLPARRRHPGYSRQDQHAVQHRVPRLRRAAGRDRDRDTSSTTSRASSARIRSTCGGATSTARTETATSRRTGMTVEDNVIHELVAELEAQRATTGSAASAIAAFNATSPVLKQGLALTPVKFGISFNVVHLQPGRRAGPRLHRRLGAGEPRRHRDGAGPQHQGRAGRRARARHRPRARALDAPPTRSKVAEHVGHRGVDRQRPERQGGAGRGAADPRAPGRVRRGRRLAAGPTTSSSPTTR